MHLHLQIGSSILRLCLQELFHFRLMQTDPNWSNFLFNKKTDQVGSSFPVFSSLGNAPEASLMHLSFPFQIELIDFGATREYGKPFMDDWYRLLKAAISDDKEAMELYSLKLGYLTGKENPVSCLYSSSAA
jgi:aarF domain-containing kinase